MRNNLYDLEVSYLKILQKHGSYTQEKEVIGHVVRRRILADIFRSPLDTNPKLARLAADLIDKDAQTTIDAKYSKPPRRLPPIVYDRR